MNKYILMLFMLCNTAMAEKGFHMYIGTAYHDKETDSFRTYGLGDKVL